jgi:transposase
MIDTACTAVGIGERTFHRWMAEGEKRTSRPFWQFRRQIEMAKAQCQIALVDTLQKSAKTDWRAAAWILERKFPTQWGATH